jgi:Ner family transcriptional regulator
MRGVTLTELSRQHGYCDRAVGIALARPWPAVERIVADFLGREPWDLWPERYDEQGRPLRVPRRAPWRRDADAPEPVPGLRKVDP